MRIASHSYSPASLMMLTTIVQITRMTQINLILIKWERLRVFKIRLETKMQEGIQDQILKISKLLIHPLMLISDQMIQHSGRKIIIETLPLLRTLPLPYLHQPSILLLPLYKLLISLLVNQRGSESRSLSTPSIKHTGI